MSVVDNVSAIHKFNPKGKQIALFEAAAATDVKIAAAGHFSVTRDGEVYQLGFKEAGGIYPPGILSEPGYVLVFSPDGRFKSKIKLDTGFPWSSLQLATFGSGEMLVVGLKRDDENPRYRRPFTGVFASNGTLTKALTLEDDNKLHEMVVSGDANVMSPDHPLNNSAVERGTLESAGDGNVYVMRRISPAIVYAVSAAGEVVRRFTVDPGRPNFVPITMHVDRSRIAVMFQEPQSRDKLIKVVDLEGSEVHAYEIPYQKGHPTMGISFICYTENPERFTFVSMKGDRLAFKFVEPQ